MTPQPLGYNMKKLQFLMPHYATTQYKGKHNHQGRAAHRFFVELSYARQSTKITAMTKLAKLINYAETYKMQSHAVAYDSSRTYPDMSKVVIYISEKSIVEVQELIYQLRYHLGILHSGERHGQKGHVLFNVSDVKDFLVQ